jgi:hypothetical protein
MSTNTLAKRGHYSGDADEQRRLRAESDAAALHALAVLCSEGKESAAFLEADAASEQATQKWIEADRTTRRGLVEEQNHTDTTTQASTYLGWNRSAEAFGQEHR